MVVNYRQHVFKLSLTLVIFYSTYKNYIENPNSYDRRSEKKKIKNGKKLKLRRQFPVSTNTTTTLFYYYS
jgi:hypothetical protein